MSILVAQRWLYSVISGVILYALGLLLFPQWMHTFFTLAFFNSSERVAQIGEQNTGFITLVYGVLGAVIIGWMIALLPLVRQLGQPAMRQALVLSIGIWFIFDTGFSLYTGFVAHALFNTIFLILFAIPVSPKIGAPQTL